MWSPPSRSLLPVLISCLTPGRQRLAGWAGLCHSHSSSSQLCSVSFRPSPGTQMPQGFWGVLPIGIPSLCLQSLMLLPGTHSTGG